jgi:hypothetical protein
MAARRQWPLILSCCLAVCPAKAAPAETDVLDQFLQDSHSPQHAMQSQSAHSASFDNWLKHYLNGQDAAAQKDWAAVLKDSGKDGDLHSLMKQAVIRLSFSNASDDNPRRNNVAAVQWMIADTEKCIAKTDWLLHDAYDYAANMCEDGRCCDKAVGYKQKEIRLEEARYGKGDSRLCGALCHLAQLLMESHQLDAAEKVLNRVAALNKTSPEVKISRRLQSLRVQLLARQKQKTAQHR